MDFNNSQSFGSIKEQKTVKAQPKNDPKTSKSQVIVRKPYEIKRSTSSEMMPSSEAKRST